LSERRLSRPKRAGTGVCGKTTSCAHTHEPPPHHTSRAMS
jgi:hypothetical protein